MHGTVDRTYDYELKYKAGEAGQAAGPDGRVWKVYLDEADSFDHDMLQGFRDNIDALLVFAALFSAVVTTFTVETKDFLQPDYAQITAFLLVEQLQLLRTGGNVTAMSYIPPSNIRLETETPSTLNLWMAGLFYTSLSLSLGTALLSILVKQWLTSYSSLTSGDTQLRCLIRQFRFSGLEHWKLPQIIRFLPLLLHFSLALFLVGFSLFVYSLYPPLSAIIITIAGTIFILYISSAILSAFYRDCPFRIPILQDLVISITWIIFHFRLLFKRLLSRLLDCISVRFPLWLDDALRPSFDPWTPSLSESQLVEDIEKNQVIVFRSFDWLFHQTSNGSVRKITTLAAADLVFERGLKPSIPLSWSDMMPVACNELFTDLESPTTNTPLLHFLQLNCGNLESPKDMSIYPTNILHRAVECRRNDLILMFLARGLNPDFVYSESSSRKRMLVLAMEDDNIPLVRLLLKFGAKGNLDGEERSPLLIAIEKDNRDITSLLLKRGATVNPKKTPLDSNILERAVESKQRDLIRMFLSNGLPPDSRRSPNSKSMLVLATESGQIDLVQDLLTFGANCNLDRAERAPLLIALEKGYTNIAALLLQNGAKPDIQSCAVDPLESAVKLRQRELILLFLVRGLSPDFVHSASSKRMLVLASEDGNIQLMKDLLRLGAKCDVDGEKISPLFIAAKRGQKEAASILLNHGALVNIKGDDGMTPLHVAVNSSFVLIAKLLCDHLADPRVRDTKGRIPLHYACRGVSQDFEMCTILAAHPDAGVNSKDNSGSTPLMTLFRLHYSEMRFHLMTFLLDNGADPNTSDNDGRTPLQLAELWIIGMGARGSSHEHLTKVKELLSRPRKEVKEDLQSHGDTAPVWR